MVQNNKEADILYGIHPLREALKAKRRKIYGVYTTRPTPKAWKELESQLNARNIPISYVTREQLSRRAASPDHQGVVAMVSPFGYRQKAFEPTKQPILLMLDGIQDPRNLGAILRSAYCTAIDGVIITQKASSPLTAAAIKASAGLAEHLEIMRVSSTISAAQTLKNSGYQLYLASFGGKNITSVTFEKPLCIVIGSEGEGISPALYKQGTSITIPQRATDISYNASVAAGIFLFLVSTQLKKI